MILTKDIPMYKLHDGYQIPSIGFGTSGITGKKGAESVENALHNGYRLIDTAIRYENEGAVGAGIRSISLP